MAPGRNSAVHDVPPRSGAQSFQAALPPQNPQAFSAAPNCGELVPMPRLCIRPMLMPPPQEPGNLRIPCRRMHLAKARFARSTRACIAGLSSGFPLLRMDRLR